MVNPENASTSATVNENSKISGDSEVQDGKGVEKQEKKTYDKSEEQQEFINNSNNNTKVAGGNTNK